MVACQQCHAESADWLKAQVFAIQDRTTSLLNRAGYATAVAAELFEAADQARPRAKISTRSFMTRPRTSISRPSTGSIISGLKLPGLSQPHRGGAHLRGLRGLCGEIFRVAAPGPGRGRGDGTPRHQPGSGQVPEQRGVKKLNFQPQQEFKDPFGIQPLLTPEASLGIK